MRLELRSRARLRLSPGVYLIPAHFTLDEVEGTAELLRDLMPDIEGVERVRWGDVLAGAGLPMGLIVIDDIPDTTVGVEEALAPLAVGAARYVLARVGPAYEKGFGWLERLVKPAVVSALRGAVRDPRPVDAAYAIENAPISQAAALTGDPLELVALVEGAIEHRVEHASEGLSREDYERSLQSVAGARLAARLARLEGVDRSTALEVLLAGGEGDRNDSRFRRGAAALGRVGLAAYTHGDIALGPLARAGAAPSPIREALLTRVPRDAWSALSTDLLARALRSAAIRSGAPAATEPVAGGRVDALVLTVLPEEHEAALQVIGHHVSDDVIVAEIGPRAVRVAIARLRDLGGFVVGAEAQALIDRTRPSIVAMCGICAGMAPNVELGDIVVADAVFRYTVRPGGAGEDRLASELLYVLEPAFRSRVLVDARSPDGHAGRVRMGAIATGKSALADPGARVYLSNQPRPILGLELETEALPVLASTGGIVVKGVAGFPGEPQDSVARRAAAGASAAWLIAFLGEHLGDGGHLRDATT